VTKEETKERKARDKEKDNIIIILEQDKIENTFKKYIKMIYLFNLDFKKFYLKNIIMKQKRHVIIITSLD
jgi:hypothetical protein